MNWTDYVREDKLPTFWCAGCGYGQVMHSMALAFAQCGLVPEKTVIVSGIGCWGHVDAYLRANAFHGTHGRALAIATGVKLANPELTVIVAMGDGDGVTIGGNHFIHAARRNIDVTAIVCNNLNYGMTGGQCSATTPEGSITSTTRYGHMEQPFDICALAIAAKAPYVARSLSENVNDTASMIATGIMRKGFSMIEAMSPCPTHYGRNNSMRSPAELYQHLKAQTIPAKGRDALSHQQLEGRALLGVLADEERKDYSTRYRELCDSLKREA